MLNCVKKISMDNRVTEINDRITKLEHGRNNPTSQEPNLAPSYAEIVGTTNSSTNVIRTLPPAERLEKLDYNSNEAEHRRKLLQV